MHEDNDAYVRAVHDKGLLFDPQTMSRRRMLAAIGGAGLAAAVGGALTLGESAATAACAAEVESETAGPYPADGSNGPNVRTTSGVVRGDIRSSFGTASGTAAGIPLTFSLTVLNLSLRPAGRRGRVCLALRSRGPLLALLQRRHQPELPARHPGHQRVRHRHVHQRLPGCYAGRWPHIHFEVFSSLANATTSNGPIVKTSQIALPKEVSQAVYATTGYSQSVTNLSRISLATDNVFRDDLAAREMATVTGSVTSGYTANLTITVRA
ncbi:intradiol ring-cleavage dioxygenase [Catellatospora tritici]|uniref:intradiol ring-cleavage dioxygenase n=1 Tax=Catellatospora tritici TaxID=2851566 RepID=UPI00355837A9